MYEEQLVSASKSNPKLFHSHVRSKQFVKDDINSIQTADGTITADREKICSSLNDYFQSVFVIEPEGYMPAFTDRTESICDVNESCFSAAILQKRLYSLDKTKSMGLDGLHPRVLSNCAAAFATPLALIYKRSFMSGVIPDTWRKSNVSPIFKKGSKLKYSNYRPVSLTPVPCKVMEGILHEHIMQHCVVNGLISKHQHGFLKKKSCLTNLLETRDILTEAVHCGYVADVVYTDFAKAFDRVPHKRLLHKLKAYGIRGMLLTWIEAWLKDRKQRVLIEGCESEWKNVTSGVPQGSVLGPLLFVLYINDLPDTITHQIKMYADDSKIIGIIKSASDISSLQADIDRAVEWSFTWLMHFNVEKCKIMHVGRSHRITHQYSMRHIDGTRRPLEVTKVERDLGVLVSDDLKVRAQVEKAASSANHMLSRLRKAFRSRSLILWRTPYLSYVRPHLEFAVQSWSPYQKGDINLLEQVQRRATKIIATLKHQPYEHRLQQLGITTLQDRRSRGDLIEQFKIAHNIDDVSFSVPQTRAAGHTAYHLRGHNCKLERQYVRGCEERYNFFTNRIVAPWNALTQYTIDAPTVNAFKDRIS